MSNSHWYHFLYDTFAVIRSIINFSLGARYALWSLRGKGGGIWGGAYAPFAPPPPPVGSGTVSDLSFVTIILKKTARNMREEVFPEMKLGS